MDNADIKIIERSSSVLIISDNRIGKINKQLDIDCDAYENAFSVAQKKLLEKWLISYTKEPLSKFMMNKSHSLSRIFNNPSSKTIFWMPNLTKSFDGEIMTIDIKITSKDMYHVKSKPAMYKTSSVMIDDLHVPLANINSVYMKKHFNQSINHQSQFIKIFLSDLHYNRDKKLKVRLNTNIGFQIYKELVRLTSVLTQEDMPTMYKYSIFIIRNADSFVIKLIDIEDDDAECQKNTHECALDTMLEFWRRAIYKDIPVLRRADDK